MKNKKRLLYDRAEVSACRQYPVKRSDIGTLTASASYALQTAYCRGYIAGWKARGKRK